MKSTLRLAFSLTGLCALSAAAALAAPAIDLGSRRELFVDDYLAGKITGLEPRAMHHPVPHEVVLVCNAPWEGSGSDFKVLMRDAKFGGSMVLTFEAIGVAFCGALLWMANLSVKKHGPVPSVA